MNQERYQEFLIDYIREALIYGDKDVSEAANYLQSQRTSRFFAKAEKKEALRRARKVFSSYQDRPLWFVLKCLGLEEEDVT